MLYTIKKYGTPDIDLSDYVTDIDKIPYWTKNLDYSLMAEGFTFKISINCGTALATDDRIIVFRNTLVVYNGIVEKVEYDEDSRLNVVTVKHILSVLQILNTSAIYAWMGLYAQSINVGGTNYNLVSFTDLIDGIVEEITISLGAIVYVDWTNATFFTTRTLAWVGYNAGTLELSDTLDETGLFFLPEQINCINQAGVFSPANITNLIAGEDAEGKRPKLFDLLSLLCSIVGISFIPKDKDTFYAVSIQNAIPPGYITDDEFFEINTEELKKQADGVVARYSSLRDNLFFGQDLPAWSDAGVLYDVGQIVTYSAAQWYCTYRNRSNANSYPGNTNPAYSFMWILFTRDFGDYYISDDPQYNGSDKNFYIDYEYSDGVDGETINWMDNFNPILINTTTHKAWVCYPHLAWPTATAVKYIMAAELNSFTKTTARIPASLVIDTTLYEFLTVYIDDINNDTVEVEYVV